MEKYKEKKLYVLWILLLFNNMMILIQLKLLVIKNFMFGISLQDLIRIIGGLSILFKKINYKATGYL